MKCSLDISNFLEEISSLSFSIVFLYFFALIAEEDFLISPCYSLEISQSWIFIGRTDVKVEIPIFWPPDVKKWLIWKDSDAGKDWRQEERGRQRIRWTYVWVSSGSRWWTGRPGVLQSLVLQRVGHKWLGHRLRLLPCWMVCLGNELRSFCQFWGCSKVLPFRHFCWLWGLLHFF